MSSPNFIESLETRMLMSVSLAKNLIVNGGAESGSGTTGGDIETIPGWSQGDANKPATVVLYGSGGSFPSVSSIGPANRGDKFFAGGNGNDVSTLNQKIDLTSLATDIDAGRIQITLSGYFGGTASENDRSNLQGLFADGSGSEIRNSSIFTQGALAFDRNNVTGLLFKTSQETIPVNTRSINVVLGMIRANFTYNDGYADNLSLVLSSTLGKKGRIAGTVRNDLDGDGKLDSGEAGLKSVQVFIDKNDNGKRDKGEYTVTTDSKGRYAFENLSPANYAVRTVIPAQFRATTANPKTVPVTAGLTSQATFLLSQTSVITGVAWIDENGNGKRDASDGGLNGVSLFLDLNDNDDLDSFEFTSTTNSKGVYRFVVPHGKYIVKGVNLSGPVPVVATDQMAINVTTAKGQIKSADFQLVPE